MEFPCSMACTLVNVYHPISIILMGADIKSLSWWNIISYLACCRNFRLAIAVNMWHKWKQYRSSGGIVSLTHKNTFRAWVFLVIWQEGGGKVWWKQFCFDGSEVDGSEAHIIKCRILFWDINQKMIGVWSKCHHPQNTILNNYLP